MKARALIAGLMVPAAILMTSCGSREDAVLAEFADQKITVADFESAYAIVNPEFLPKTSGVEGYKEFLTTMLNKEVMAYKADELGYDKDPTVVRAMENWKKMGLQAAYLKFRVADKVTVSEKDVREHWEKRGTTMAVKQILLDTPAEAEEVMAVLDGGADFDSVVKKYSKSPDAAQGGTVMTVAYGRYSPELQEAIFSTEVGDYTDPILTPYGYFIVKNLRRTEATRKEPFDEVRDTMEREILAIKQHIARNVYTEKLREEYGVEWYWDNLKICFEALPPDREYSQAPGRSNEVYPLLYFDPEDLEKPVARYGDKEILIKDFSDYYDGASFYTRPRRDYRVAGCRAFILERLMGDIVQREMKRSNIQDEPEVRTAMEGKEEQLMINRLWEDMVNKQTAVTDQMLRDYYDNNRDDFKLPEKRRFGVILTGDVESAQKAYSELQEGTLFRTVAMAYSIDEETSRTLYQTELLAKGEQPEIDEVGFALPDVGSISEPFETSRGWMVVKVTELEPEGEFTFEQAKPSIEAALKEQVNDDRLNELLDKWKEELNLAIHEDNLAKIDVEERSPAEQPERHQH
jgi:parvulin-like peptidyl-prolyl isomerase